MHRRHHQEGARPHVYATCDASDESAYAKLIWHIAGFRENTQNRVDLPTIKYKCPAPLALITASSGVVLEKVCEYLYYNQKHAESKDVSDMDIPPELCLELLIAADYLDGMHIKPQTDPMLIEAV
jgi:hypothetical protein